MPPSTALVDWLVITAANRRQAEACRPQLAERQARGALPEGCRTLVVPDARDARIGSGAATVLALAEVAGRVHAARGGRASVPASRVQDVLAGQRILMIHSGGDSRRLPAYAAEGKLFASLPIAAPGMRCAALLDVLLQDLLSLEPRPGGELLIASGDCVIGLRDHPVTLEGEGIIGVAHRMPLSRAIRHGVYVCSPQGGGVRRFMQKPAVRDLRAAGGELADGMALADTGLLSIDPATCARLLQGAGVERVGPKGPVQMREGGLAALASLGQARAVDLYREILCAVPRAMTRAAYRAMVSPELRRPLDALRGALCGTPFHCRITEASEFLHIGSTREMIASLAGPRAAIRAFGHMPSSVPAAPHRVAGGGTALALDSSLGSLEIAHGRAVIDRCALDRLRIGGGNLLVGLRGLRLGEIPKGISIAGIPQRGRADPRALAVFGLDDDFKTPSGAGGTWLGRPLRTVWRRTGLDEALLRPDSTLWDLPLWPVVGGGALRDAALLVSWMWTGAHAPPEWMRARRIPMRDAVAHADIRAIIAERTESARSAAARASGPTLLRVADPVTRAHTAALLCTVPGRSASAIRRLRRIAFEAVGESVVAAVPLPAAAPQARILHDQAVWASSPVRIDLAGGWTDTPPVCSEIGGAVVNAAIALRGQLPVQVVAKLEEEHVVRITSTDLGLTRTIRSASDLARRGDPRRWSSLAECALMVTGCVPSHPDASLQSWLRRLGGGISITMFSAVPKGSGLGTSSILGAAAIRCLDRLLGRERSAPALVEATSALEQMLGSGGGWQDQAGSVMGGFKLCRSEPGAVQRPVLEPIRVPAEAMRELERRSVLYFTGHQRMARSILEQAVWGWLAGRPGTVDAMHRLRANAQMMSDALRSGDVDRVLHELSRYRMLKRRVDPGSCTPAFESLAASWDRHLSSWCFAGAGGGGFMLLVARSEGHAASLRNAIGRSPPHPRARAFDLEVAPVGLACAVL